MEALASAVRPDGLAESAAACIAGFGTGGAGGAFGVFGFTGVVAIGPTGVLPSAEDDAVEVLGRGWTFHI